MRKCGSTVQLYNLSLTPLFNTYEFCLCVKVPYDSSAENETICYGCMWERNNKIVLQNGSVHSVQLVIPLDKDGIFIVNTLLKWSKSMLAVIKLPLLIFLPKLQKVIILSTVIFVSPFFCIYKSCFVLPCEWCHPFI